METPSIDPTQGDPDGYIEAVEVEVRERILANLHELDSPEANASRALYERILDSCQTLHLLRRCAGHRWEVDGMTILRAVYDATIQALWLLHDPKQRTHRGSLYIAFVHIEQENRLRWMNDSDSGAADYLRSSPLRVEGEPRHSDAMTTLGPEFAKNDRARRYFEKPDERGADGWIPGLRRHWYQGELKDIANDVGYEDECAWLFLDASSSVHSSSIHLLWGTTIRPEFIAFQGSQLALRAMGAVAKAFGFPLNPAERELTESANRSLCQAP